MAAEITAAAVYMLKPDLNWAHECRMSVLDLMQYA